MEKQSKHIDKITKKIINDGGLHQPSESFLSNVMEAIATQTENQPIVYKPLISKSIWILLFVFSALVFILLFIFPVFSEVGFFSQLTLPEQINFKFNLPEMNLSKNTIYGIGFLSLFLIQIPFLKKQLNKSF